MDLEDRTRLEASGFRVGDADDFLHDDGREVLSFVGGPYDGLQRLASEMYSDQWRYPVGQELYVPGWCRGYKKHSDGTWRWFDRG